MWVPGRRSAPLLRQRGPAVGIEMGRNWAPLIRPAQGPAPTAPPGPLGWSPSVSAGGGVGVSGAPTPALRLRFCTCQVGLTPLTPPQVAFLQLLRVAEGHLDPSLPLVFRRRASVGKDWGGQSLWGNASHCLGGGAQGRQSHGNRPPASAPALCSHQTHDRSTCRPSHPARWPGSAPPPRTQVQGPPLGPPCPPRGPHGGAQPRKGAVPGSPPRLQN